MAKKRKSSKYFRQEDWQMWAGRMRLGDAVVVSSYDHVRRLTLALRRDGKRAEIWKDQSVGADEPSRWRVTCVTRDVNPIGSPNRAIQALPVCDRCLHGNHGACDRGQVSGKRAPVECACPHPAQALTTIGTYKRESALTEAARVAGNRTRAIAEAKSVVKSGWISRAAADRLNREIAEWRRAAEAQQASDGVPSTGTPSE